jgi:GNAT superfamily N-acetyltransferase
VSAESAIVRLSEADIEAAADVLARAFYDDPFAIHVLPEADEREDLLFWYFGTIVQYGLLFGEVYSTPRCEGVAVWLPYDGRQEDADRLRQTGLLDAPDVLGMEAFHRLVAIAGHLELLRKSDLPTRYWYVPAIGVDPRHQGRGVGGALLRSGYTRADAEGVPCYLETFKETNAPFYGRHGFERLVASAIPGNGPRFWTFRRDPVAHSGAEGQPRGAATRP